MPLHRVGVDFIPCGWEAAVLVYGCMCVWWGAHVHLPGELLTGNPGDGNCPLLHTCPCEL